MGGKLRLRSVRTKILAALLAMAAVVALVGGVAANRMSAMNQKTDAIYRDALLPLNDVATIREQFYRARLYLGLGAIANSELDRGFSVDQADASLAKLEKTLATFRAGRPDVADQLKFWHHRREKLEQLGYGEDFSESGPDLFDQWFTDHTIDPATGALLGRFIAEERDSVRILHGAWLAVTGRA